MLVKTECGISECNDIGIVRERGKFAIRGYRLGMQSIDICAGLTKEQAVEILEDLFNAYKLYKVIDVTDCMCYQQLKEDSK